MSQDRPVGDPLSYASAYVRVPSPRPTSVTVLAIVAIILGSLAVLGMLCSLPQYLGVRLMPNPVVDSIRGDRVLLIYMIAAMVVGLLLGVLLLASGIGMLSLRRIARKGMIWYAMLYILVTIPSIIITATVVNPRMLQAMSKSTSFSPPGMKGTMQLSQYVGTGVSILMLVWPALILYYLTRPHVKAAFERTPRSLPALPTEPQSPQL